MRNMFTTKPTAPVPFSQNPASAIISCENYTINYLSNWSNDEDDIDEDKDGNGADTEDQPRQAFPLPLKQQKLDVSYRVQCAKKHAAQISDFTAALKDIDKMIRSKKTKFLSGPYGLQAR